MNDGKQAALSAIQKINAVEGFDPTPLAVEYVDLNTQEKRSRLPVMAQLAWFRLKYPEGRVSVAVTAAKDCFGGYGQGLSQLHKPARTVPVGGDRIPRLPSRQTDGISA